MDLGQCIDLCSGAGGWEVAARELGIDTLGIELDDAPVAVARAAGFRVLRADIATLEPREVLEDEFVNQCDRCGGFGLLDPTTAVARSAHPALASCPACALGGLIASVPCPTFSSAGRGAGRELEAKIRECLADIAAGCDTREQRRREAYAILEPDTAHLDVLPAPRRSRKREQHAASPVDRDRIARREAKRATAKRDAAISLLVVEPLRWALALEPRWIALEQVPPVLPIWQAMAVVLRERGYSTWCGIMSSERVGVPQTRQRAILIASLDREVREPPATHQRYIVPRKNGRETERETEALFALEPERIVHREDRDLLPWVSMAEALQWPAGREVTTERSAGMSERHGERPARSGEAPAPTLTIGGKCCGPRWAVSDGARADGEWVDGPSPSPSPSVTAGGTGSGGGVEVFAGREARERAASAVRFVSNGQANATTRDVDEPAPTILFRPVGSRGRFVHRPRVPPLLARRVGAGGGRHKPRRAGMGGPDGQLHASSTLRSARALTDRHSTHRHVDDPSLTITGRTDLCSWEPPTHYDRRQEQGPRHEDGSRERVRLLSVDEPAPTQQAEALAKGRDVWVTERPSTSVNCDPRVAEPGRHDPKESGLQYGAATIRVSIAEAAALQSFPPSYPWEAAGTRTAAFKCVGNAVPCLLALHVLAMATGREIP